MGHILAVFDVKTIQELRPAQVDKQTSRLRLNNVDSMHGVVTQALVSLH